MGITVVVPVAPGDEAWREIIPDLTSLSEEDELLLVSPCALGNDLSTLANRFGLKCPHSWVKSERGRAKQLNLGARLAKREYIWFLHCDSKIPKQGIEKLKSSLKDAPAALHYFNLAFMADGPRALIANNFGVWIRSHVFQLPFGDQGFAMHRSTFKMLGEFPESAPYGEDHLLIWHAHQSKVKLRPVGVTLYTSARKYKANGWGRTTLQHLSITVRQAIPEFIRLIQLRLYS